MSHFSPILFDLDGTLTDPKPGITKSVQYALQRFGIHEPDLDRLECFIGPPLRASFQSQYHFDQEQAERAVEAYREYFRDAGIFENAVYPGIPALLERLQGEGRQLYLATSKPWEFAARILAHFHLDGYFQFVGGSEMDGSRSEKDEVIRHVMETAGIPQNAGGIMVGDRSFDILGAKATGLASIGVLYGYGSREELVQAGADYIVGDVQALELTILSIS